MDPLLQPFLTATDHRRQDELLQNLLLTEAVPLIRQILRRKLAFHVSADGHNPTNHDAEDLFQEIVTRIVQTLRTLATSDPPSEIENFHQYVARIATNACVDVVRARSPARTRLKNNLRFLLTHNKSFAVWKIDEVLYAGFDSWRHSPESGSADIRTIDPKEAAVSFRNEYRYLKNPPISKLVAQILTWLGSPVELERLVSLVAELTNVKDQPVESLDEITQNHQIDLSFVFVGTSALEAAELLERLWHCLHGLTLDQRKVFAFGFEHSEGQDLFTLLIQTKVVTLGKLAAQFAMTPAELAELWPSLPMDNEQIAATLNTNLQQVYKWRFRALQRLRGLLAT